MNNFRSRSVLWHPYQAGFAYLWTLLLVAFLGVSLVMAGDLYSTTIAREKEKDLLFIGHEFRNAIARYYESNQGGAQHQYPTSLDDLINDVRYPGTHRYLRRVYVDPITGKNDWGTVLVKGHIVGVHSLSPKLPIKQDNFEVLDAALKGKSKYSEWVFSYPFDIYLQKSDKLEDLKKNGESSTLIIPDDSTKGSG